MTSSSKFMARVGLISASFLIRLILSSGVIILGSALRIFREHWIPLPEADESLFTSEGVTSDTLNGRGEGGERQPIRRISINKAGIQDFEQLPGIGPVMAKRIVDFRSSQGRFEHLEDLKKVRGIGEKTFEKLTPFIGL